MNKKILFIFLIIFFYYAPSAFADTCSLSTNPSRITTTDNEATLIIGENLNQASTYTVNIDSCNYYFDNPVGNKVQIVLNKSNNTFNGEPADRFCEISKIFNRGTHRITLDRFEGTDKPSVEICTATFIVNEMATCNSLSPSKNNYIPGEKIEISGQWSNFSNQKMCIKVIKPDNSQHGYSCKETDSYGKITISFDTTEGLSGTWKANSYYPEGILSCNITAQFEVSSNPVGIPTTSTSTSTSTNVCGGASGDKTNPESPIAKCLACLGCGDPSNQSSCANLGSKSWTALGCVDTDPGKFVGQILPGAIGVGGGIAFLIMLWGIFTIIVSSGNPEKLNQGKEMIVSAIAGLLMILFSVFLLRVIGVDILRIPGLE